MVTVIALDRKRLLTAALNAQPSNLREAAIVGGIVQSFERGHGYDHVKVRGIANELLRGFMSADSVATCCTGAGVKYVSDPPCKCQPERPAKRIEYTDCPSKHHPASAAELIGGMSLLTSEEINAGSKAFRVAWEAYGDDKAA